MALLLIGSVFPAALLAADPPWVARSRIGMVASDSPEASRIGADILAAGGNAFDAAVATSLALAVARPHSTGLGGGGFMLAYLAKEQRVVVLDFRETAPAGATADRFAKLQAQGGDGPSPSIYGGNAIGVPGQLAGLTEILKRFGSLPLKQLAQPALELAQTGFVADEHYLDACTAALADYEKWPQLKQRHARLYETLLGKGTPPKLGDRVKRPDLAEALRLIAKDGPDAFYQGPLGEAVARAAQAAGGTLTRGDLAAYRVREREPIRAVYRDSYEIVSMPPPSSGGVCIAETLNILDAVSLYTKRYFGPEQPHALVEAMKHAFADRARWLGDPDFADVPVKRLTDYNYAVQLARWIEAGKTLASSSYGGVAAPPDDGGTSHFCVADNNGNIVALTETINGPFGSLVVAEPYGIILNNQMDDFAANPGQPNLYGLIQGEANAVAPGKRPLSSMSPTLVFRVRDAKPVLVLGASGGPRIITSVVQVILNIVERRRPLDEAISAARFHHQWLPDEVYFDREPPRELADMLRENGHQISEQRKTSIVQAIQFLEDGTMVGASDPRKGGRPAAPPP
ncbi:MAG: gamma-glutamyltransferase [Phycisphaerae bacterium]|nr:gamma-glutamyltransferase [Phycisphaerae bacterium]